MKSENTISNLSSSESKKTVLEGFVHPCCRPADTDSTPSGRAVFALALFVVALVLLAFSDYSLWFAVAGGFFSWSALLLAGFQVVPYFLFFADRSTVMKMIPTSSTIVVPNQALQRTPRSCHVGSLRSRRAISEASLSLIR